MARALHIGHAHVLEAETLARLGPRGNLEAQRLARGRGHVDRTTQGGLVHGNRHIDRNVGGLAATLEHRVVGDVELDEHAAARAAVHTVLAMILVPQLHTVVATGGNRHLDGVALPRRGDAMRHTALGAVQGLVERHIDHSAQIVALASASAAAAKHVAEIERRGIGPICAAHALAAEHAAKDIGHRRTAGAAGIRIAALTGNAAELQHHVVLFALVRIGQRLIRLGDLLELRLVATAIGVVLLSQLAKRRLDLLVGGVLAYAQHIVKALR